MSVFGMGSEATANTPSSNSDSRAVAYDQGINATGKKSKVQVTTSDLYGQAQDQGFVARDGNVISILDGGVISKAFDFASENAARLFAASENTLTSGAQLLATAASASDPTAGEKRTNQLMLAGLAVLALLLFFPRGVKL